MRSSRSAATLLNAVALSRYPGELPAGDYEVVIEEGFLPRLGSEAWRRTATHLTARGKRSCAERTETRATTDGDLKQAPSRDQAVTEKSNHSEAALFPQEDLK